MESFELVLVLLACVIIAAAGVVCFQFAIAAAPPRLREQHRPRALRGLHALRCLSARRGTARERHLGRRGSGGASHAARTLIEEHRSIEQTLQERVGYSDEQPGVGAGKMFDPSTCVLSEQFRLSREYIEMITAGALSAQLDKIGELQGRGEIDEDIAQQLRQNVYVLQMNAEAE